MTISTLRPARFSQSFGYSLICADCGAPLSPGSWVDHENGSLCLDCAARLLPPISGGSDAAVMEPETGLHAESYCAECGEWHEPQARYAAPVAGRSCRRCNEPLEAHETVLCWACQMDLDSRNKVTVAAPSTPRPGTRSTSGRRSCWASRRPGLRCTRRCCGSRARRRWRRSGWRTSGSEWRPGPGTEALYTRNYR